MGTVATSTQSVILRAVAKDAAFVNAKPQPYIRLRDGSQIPYPEKYVYDWSIKYWQISPYDAAMIQYFYELSGTDMVAEVWLLTEDFCAVFCVLMMHANRRSLNSALAAKSKPYPVPVFVQSLQELSHGQKTLHS